MTSFAKSLESSLIERLTAALGVHEFKFVKARRSWYKKTPPATYAFHLAVLHYRGDFDVIADMAVRLERLARFFEELFGGREQAERVVGRFTVGVEIGNYTMDQPRQWTVASPEDVERTASSLLEVFETVAVPYYQRFSDPERVLEVLSGDSREHQRHVFLPHVGAIRAVGLAFLLGRRQEFEELAVRKRALLAASKDLNAQENLPIFDKVVEQLRARWAGVANAEA